MGTYIDSNLMPGEKVVYQTTLHWIVFLIPLPLLLLAIWALYTGIAGQRNDQDTLFMGIVTFISLVSLSIILVIFRLIAWKTSEFAATNKRVIIKVGWIRRNTLELLLNKVESVAVDQGILGRMFNFGSITLTGTGGGKSTFKNIEDPMTFRNEVNTLVEEAEA